ncbi:unnamed protein product, partial [Adineta steineri]
RLNMSTSPSSRNNTKKMHKNTNMNAPTKHQQQQQSSSSSSRPPPPPPFLPFIPLYVEFFSTVTTRKQKKIFFLF